MNRSLDEFLGGYRPPRLTVSVTQRADLLGELTAAANAYDRVRSTSEALNGGEAAVLAAEIERLAAEVAASQFEFTFEAISSHDYAELVRRHPPTPEHAQAGLAFNADTFPVALIARCAVEPTITPGQAQQLLDSLSDKQFEKLWAAAAAVNVGGDEAPKFVRPSSAAAEIETSPDSPLSAASPEASSSYDL